MVRVLEAQAVVHGFVVNVPVEPISGRLQAFSVTLAGKVPEVERVTETVDPELLVWNCETGRMIVVVATFTAML